MRAFLAVLFISASLAGCVDDDGATTAPQLLQWETGLLTSERFSILPSFSHWTTSSADGVGLHTKVWLPDTSAETGWEAPVILVDTPYQTPGSRDDPLDATSRPAGSDYSWLIDHFVPRGYAVAFKDVRGTGESGGCIEQTGAKQRQDGFDVIEDLASQDWSNGKVGMYGRSYRAETQYGAAILRPPSLATIIPVASVSGQYEWNFYDGVPFTLHSITGQAVYAATSGAPPATSPEGIVEYPRHYECQADMLAAGLDMSGDWNDYWEERELRKHFDQIEASVLYVHGLQDWNVRHVAIRDAWEHIGSEKRLMLGQWGHAFPDNYYPGDEGRDDWREMVHAWFDHELLGIENGIMAALPAVQVQNSVGHWRMEEAWPPEDHTDLTLHLTGDETMQEAPADDFSLLLRENEEAFLRAQGLPVDDLETAPETILTFTSPPLSADVLIAGWPTLEFDARLFDGFYPDPDSVIDAHFAANLFIDGDWVNAGYLSASHRDGVEAPQPVPEEERITYTLRFHPQDTVAPAGSVLTLTLAGSDDATQPEGTLWGAEVLRGTLSIPVVERDHGEVGLDVPTQAAP